MTDTPKPPVDAHDKPPGRPIRQTPPGVIGKPGRQGVEGCCRISGRPEK